MTKSFPGYLVKSSHTSYSVDVRPTFFIFPYIQFLELIKIFVVAQKRIKIFVIIVFWNVYFFCETCYFDDETYFWGWEVVLWHYWLSYRTFIIHMKMDPILRTLLQLYINIWSNICAFGVSLYTLLVAISYNSSIVKDLKIFHLI